MPPETGPYHQDHLTRIVNVQWAGGGVFSFAGNITLNIVTGDPPRTTDVQLSWLGGTSKDGEEWTSGANKSGLALFCCVRGKIGDQFVTVAAGTVVVSADGGHGFPVFGAEPAAGISYDDGVTWSDAGIPVEPYILKPANPVTGEGADTVSGNCNACVYHPSSQTFYVGGSVIFSVGADTYWEDRMYSISAGGLLQIYSARRELFDPFQGYRWPTVEVTPDLNPADRLRVADMTTMTPSGDGTIFVVSFGPDQQAEYTNINGDTSYLSVMENRSGANMGDTGIFPPMAVVNSVCGGRAHIVAVGWQDDDRLVGPVTFVSADDGLTWMQQLSELTHTNPGPEDMDTGSSGGSCSFGIGK